MKHQKIGILLITILFLGIAAGTFAAPRLEIDYAALPPLAPNPPTSLIGDSALSTYVVYVFGFAIIVSALLALIMIAIGGVEYIYSAGNPGIYKNAVSKITSSVLGLVILACSFLILRTINPNLVDIYDPNVPPLISKINFGVWACTERMDVNWLWTTGKSGTKSKSVAKTYSERQNDFLNKCRYIMTEMSTPSYFENKISYIYLIPEEGVRDFGVIIYEDASAKSLAKVIYGNGKNNSPPLNEIVEWPLPDKKVARFRPFEMINNSPTSWFARIYELVHLNRDDPNAKLITCSTMGAREAWCDLSVFSPTPEPESSPGDTGRNEGSNSLGILLSQSTDSSSDSDNNTPNNSQSGSKPPKISSVEINGSHFVIFFKDYVETWGLKTMLDVVGPSNENNLSSGKYIMGSWNEECKMKNAEEPNKEAYYPCAKRAFLVSAKFL